MTAENEEQIPEVDEKVTVIRKGRGTDDDPLLYVPSEKEQAILDVLLNPETQPASITRQCELAGISREMYYRYMRKKPFVDYYHALLKEAVRARGAELVAIGMKFARQGSFPHFKLLMQMGGIFDEKSSLLQGTGDIAEITIRFVDPDAEVSGDTGN